MPPHRARSNSANGNVISPTTSSTINNNGSHKPRLFQCTGYGDCRMVFTRSEHLARHARKHTGEKPFKCIMPDCNKMFSRFDNMMQHTQTHRNHHHQQSDHQPLLRRRRRSSTTSSTSSNGSTHTTLSSSSSSSSSITTLSDHDPVIPTVTTNTKFVTKQSNLPTSPPTSTTSHAPRRLSIADLCNPPTTHHMNTTISKQYNNNSKNNSSGSNGSSSSSSSSKDNNNNSNKSTKKERSTTGDPMLTQDELEALQAFGRLQRVTTSDFFDSLRDLVSDRQCACL